MQYFPPPNDVSGNPDAPYVNAVPGVTEGSSVHAKAVEGTMREIVNAIIAAGLVPDGEDFTQLAGIIGGIDKLPVGAEIMWENSIIPPKFLEQNGASFNGGTYPLLAAHLGSTTLPDMRGEFARGWDHGRGIDTGRTLGSTQADMFKSHTHQQYYEAGHMSGGNREVARGISVGALGEGVLATGGAETRPRNRAKIWLIKAL